MCGKLVQQHLICCLYTGVIYQNTSLFFTVILNLIDNNTQQLWRFVSVCWKSIVLVVVKSCHEFFLTKSWIHLFMVNFKNEYVWLIWFKNEKKKRVDYVTYSHKNKITSVFNIWANWFKLNISKFVATFTSLLVRQPFYFILSTKFRKLYTDCQNDVQGIKGLWI